MVIDLTDKRRSERLSVDYEAEFRVTGSERLELGRIKDLSAGGFLLRVDRALEPGTGLSVTLRSGLSELVAAAWVLRTSAAGDDDYHVACAFD